jgi:hypothetical protein
MALEAHDELVTTADFKPTSSLRVLNTVESKTAAIDAVPLP